MWHENDVRCFFSLQSFSWTSAAAAAAAELQVIERHRPWTKKTKKTPTVEKMLRDHFAATRRRGGGARNGVGVGDDDDDDDGVAGVGCWTQKWRAMPSFLPESGPLRTKKENYFFEIFASSAVFIVFWQFPLQ